MMTSSVNDLKSEVEFYFSAEGLPNLDTFSNTDPFAIVYFDETQGSARHWTEIGRTETIDDTQKPSWTKQFKATFQFEMMQYVRVVVVDRDSASEDLSKHDVVGTCEFTMGQMMGAKGQSLTVKLVPAKGSKNVGSIKVRAEEICGSADILQLKLSANKLDNKDGFFGKSDPFFIFSRSREDGTWMPVFKSPHIMNNLNPKWQPVSIPIQSLCNNDYNRPLRLEVWDWDSDGTHDFIGSCQVDVSQLMDMCKNSRPRDVINANKKAKKKKYVNSGTVSVDFVNVIKNHTMLEYLRGGTEISFIACIDYTASNGSPQDPQSLHYMSPGGFNEYQRSIMTIGQIIQEYDYDKLFPVYGFGGMIAGTNSVNHCFPLTFDPSNPEVRGVEGILSAYVSSMQSVRLHGPTCFAPIINAAASCAAQSRAEGSKKYIVMLILTDGVIMDMEQTRDAIVSASDLPLSIIIVGVGGANFSAMEVLDGDDGAVLKDSRGKAASRDIVQFVPMRKFKSSDISLLAKETLIEVPEQLVSYMKSANVAPSPINGNMAIGSSVAPPTAPPNGV